MLSTQIPLHLTGEIRECDIPGEIRRSRCSPTPRPELGRIGRGGARGSRSTDWPQARPRAGGRVGGLGDDREVRAVLDALRACRTQRARNGNPGQALSGKVEHGDSVIVAATADRAAGRAHDPENRTDHDEETPIEYRGPAPVSKPSRMRRALAMIMSSGFPFVTVGPERVAELLPVRPTRKPTRPFHDHSASAVSRRT